MDFVTELPILTDLRRNGFNFIFIIVDRLIKKLYYKPVKISINASGLAKVIINVIVC